MKISKLFHWLYAFLMLLPIAIFIPSGLYYAFNKEAVVNAETKEVYQTRQIDFNQLIQNGNFQNTDNWTAVSNRGTISVSENTLTYNVVNAEGGSNNRITQLIPSLENKNGHKLLVRYYFYSDFTNSTRFSFNGGALNTTTNGLQYDWFLSQNIVICSSNINTLWLFSGLTGVSIRVGDTFSFRNVNLFDLTQMFGVGNEPSINQFNSLFPNDFYDYTLSSPMTITIDTGDTKQYTDIVSNVSNAWDDVWQLPLFSWSGNSFLTAPFNYITALFGMPNNSTFVYALSYWLAISLVYLVFDIVMYVPLLVHRLIDKARIE